MSTAAKSRSLDFYTRLVRTSPQLYIMTGIFSRLSICIGGVELLVIKKKIGLFIFWGRGSTIELGGSTIEVGHTQRVVKSPRV